MSRSRHITPEGFRKLQEEADHLWTVERPRVTREVQVAAAHGDRSENAEYIYGKKRLREIDARLRFLRKRIDEVVVVAPSSVEHRDRALFGAWVTLEDETGASVRYRLVGADEFDASRGWISVDSPVGRALLGRVVDEEVVVRRPRGPATYTLTAIAYEASEDDPPDSD